MISTPIFACFYLFFCLLPLSIRLRSQKMLSRSFIVVYTIIYLFIVLILTQLPVSVSKECIRISFKATSQKIFGISFGLNNIFLNAALVLPMGNLCLLHKSQSLYLNTHAFVLLPPDWGNGLTSQRVGKNKNHTDVFYLGLLLGIVLEFLQLLLPFGRCVDPVDVLLCGLFAWLAERGVEICLKFNKFQS